jgi:hypothetical protein
VREEWGRGGGVGPLPGPRPLLGASLGMPSGAFAPSAVTTPQNPIRLYDVNESAQFDVRVTCVQ